MSDGRTLLGRLWDDYAALNPQAGAIHALLTAEGETVVNDHVALRTFDDPRVSIEVIASGFERSGYHARSDYTFPEKKLTAKHYEHADAAMPKIFISQLRLRKCSERLQDLVSRLLDQMPAGLPLRDDFCVAGRPWALRFRDYEALAAESEYAGWLGALGFRANHFTVLVNGLRRFPDLRVFNEFLKRHGFELNTSGGEIKGSPAEYLEQSSTLASQVEVDFTDGRRSVPGCYYEFARRYPLPDGRLFSGFVAGSADKIFESTDRR